MIIRECLSSINLEFFLTNQTSFFPVIFFLLSGYYLFTSSAAPTQYWYFHPLLYFLLTLAAEAILRVRKITSRRSCSCSWMLSLHYFELSASCWKVCRFLQLYRLCSYCSRWSLTTCSLSLMPLIHRHSCLQLLLCRSLLTSPIMIWPQKLLRHR